MLVYLTYKRVQLLLKFYTDIFIRGYVNVNVSIYLSNICKYSDKRRYQRSLSKGSIGYYEKYRVVRKFIREPAFCYKVFQ